MHKKRFLLSNTNNSLSTDEVSIVDRNSESWQKNYRLNIFYHFIYTYMYIIFIILNVTQSNFVVSPHVPQPLGFGAVFNDIHLWAVIFAVIIINYVFQDGKSDYFQGKHLGNEH